VPQAAASKALAEDGPFDSPKSPKRFISANAGKGEVLQQFFNEHPEVQPNTSATSQIESTKPSVTENLDSKRSGNHSIPLDDMPSGSKAATFATPSHLDAFLVLRSLCKLSMRALPDSLNVSSSFSTHPEISNTDDDRTGHSSSVGSNPAMESKILALELLLYVLDHATPSAAMFSTPSFSFAIRNYLCVSLLKNCTSSNTRIVALSLRLFIPIIRHFREGLKTEIEAFVTNVFFVILDSPNSTVEHKSLVVTLFQEICSCEDTLAEIFLNYDCDLSAVDLFHRIVTALSRVASKVGGETDFSDRGVFSSGNPQSAAMRQALRELKLSAMRALRQVLASLYESVRVEGLDARLNCTSTDDSITAYSGDGASVYSNNHSLSSYDALGESAQHSEGTIPVSGPPLSKGSAIVKIYDSKKKMREQEVEILIRFNQKPAAGIKYAGECGFIDASNPVEVAKFLMASKDKLDKTQIGDYLGREPEFQGGFGVRVLHAYVDMLDFNEMSFDDAIRYFLSGFRLPGEAQKIDRIMEKFAERFCKQNPHIFPTADTAFILGFSVIMLNTDLHNPAIKEERRMTKEGFRRNNRGICDGKDLPDEFLNGIFDRIRTTPISLKEDDDARKKVKPDKNAGNFLFGNHQDAEEVNRSRETKFLQERVQIVRNTELILQQRRKGGKGNKQHSSSLAAVSKQVPSKFVRTSDALKDEYVAPMFDVTWGPALAVFSTAVESTGDIQKLASYATDQELDLIYENAAETLDVCLNGFRLAICTAGLCGNETARSAFVQALYNFTRLGTSRLLGSRNLRCVQATLRLAQDDGELLGNTWEHIFKALSEVNRLLQIHDEIVRQERGRLSSRRHVSSRRFDGDDDSFSTNESDMYGSEADFALHEEDMDRRMIDEENAIAVYEAVPDGIVDKIFHRSSALSNTAVKEFIFQLCRVSRMEIAGYGGHVGSRANFVCDGNELPEGTRKHQPVIYSLQQIVQVTHYNMESRSRLVFAEIWSTVAAHLTSTALHSNPAVTMYAVDSLRQLGLQFLQREELGMFEFQRKFLRPYEAVMERSKESTTKELLLNSVQQMIMMFGVSNDTQETTALDDRKVSSLKRGTLRSGWKSVLIVLGIAAHDDDDTIAHMGYETLSTLAIRTAVMQEDKDSENMTGNNAETSLLLNEHFVDLVDSLIMYVSGTRVDLSMHAIGHLKDMAAWLADEHIPLPVMRKAPTRMTYGRNVVEEKSSCSSDAVSADLELWWPILLGFSRNIGHFNRVVRDECLDTLKELVKKNFFPQDSNVEFQSGNRASNHVNIQTLRLIFKGILLPALEHAETDRYTFLAIPPIPEDLEFILLKKGKSQETAVDNYQNSWMNTTLESLLDSCIQLCLESIDAFESEDMVEEMMAIFNACLVSDAGAVAVIALRRLHKFLTGDLGRDQISSNTWATVSHMLLRSLVVRTSQDPNASPAEQAIIVSRQFVPSNATMIIGKLMCDEDYASSMGLNWYLFITTGLGRSIKEWETSTSAGKEVSKRGLSRDSHEVPPTHSENILYARQLLVKLLLNLASKRHLAEVSKGTVHQLLKEETQAILSSFLQKETAFGPNVAGESYKNSELVEELRCFTRIVFSLLDGLNNLEDDCLFEHTWLCPMLSSLIQCQSETVRKAVHILVSRLFEKKIEDSTLTAEADKEGSQVKSEKMSV